MKDTRLKKVCEDLKLNRASKIDLSSETPSCNFFFFHFFLESFVSICFQKNSKMNQRDLEQMKF